MQLLPKFSYKHIHLVKENRNPSNIPLHARPLNIFNKNTHNISKNIPSFNPKMMSPQQKLVSNSQNPHEITSPQLVKYNKQVKSLLERLKFTNVMVNN